MNLNIRYPSVSDGTTEEQLDELRSYLYQMVETLNACDTSALAIMSELSQAVNASELPDAAKRPETELKLQEYSALRSLIIKTADYAAANSERFSLSLQGNYVAVSDFGKYFENATVDINGTPYGITQLYNYSAGIDAENTDYRVQQESYIKSGLLYYDSNSLPVYGVGVGNIYGDFAVYGLTQDETINNAKTYYTKNGDTYTEVDEPKQSELSTYYERVMSRQTGQLSSTFTADEIAFWSGSTKLAYMNTGAVYFPNANITGGSIQIGGTDANPTFSVNSSGYMKATSGKIANWNIGTDNLYTDGATFSGTTGMYFGASGLRISKNFKVDSEGHINATGGTFSGELKAATGTFSGSLSAATGTFAGTLSAGVGIESPNISGDNINVTGHVNIYSSGGYGSSYVGNLGYGLLGAQSGPGLFHTSGAVVLAGGAAAAMQFGSSKVTAASDAVLLEYGSNVLKINANGVVYNGTTVHSSDANVKSDINHNLDAYEVIFDNLKPCSYKYIYGTTGRDHTGFIAQEVREAIEASSLTTNNFAAYVDFMENEEPFGSCGLRYSEFVALNTWQIQKLKARVEALEQKIGG